MDRREGDDEFPGAPGKTSADAGRLDCRRPLPVCIRRIGTGQVMNKIICGNCIDIMPGMPAESVDLIIISPPYFDIKAYGNGEDQIGNIHVFDSYISKLLEVWCECQRVLVPNGKLVINAPSMPISKDAFDTHHNLHIYDINSAIQHSIIHDTGLYLYDTYIWARPNPTKTLMLGSYPFPGNLYAQNTVEYITVYVKDGIPKKRSIEEKEQSKLSKKEWLDYTKQVWNISVPHKRNESYGRYPALMPTEIARRCVRMFSFVGDTILDPMCGSGTTCKMAKLLGRNYLGIDISEEYCKIARERVMQETLI